MMITMMGANASQDNAAVGADLVRQRMQACNLLHVGDTTSSGCTRSDFKSMTEQSRDSCIGASNVNISKAWSSICSAAASTAR